MCVLKTYREGEVILDEGSTGLGLFLISAGRVEVFKTLEERRIRLAVLSAGDVQGQIALLDNRPRSATARALEPTECLLLSRDRFRTLLKGRPRIAWPIVPALARRVRDLQEQLLAAESRALTRLAYRPPAAAERPARGEAGPPAAATAERQHEGAERAAATDGAASASTGRLGLLRTPYALLMTGASGLDETARLIETFLRSLDEATGLTGDRPLPDVLRDFPAGLLSAAASSWEAGLDVPPKMIEIFRGHLLPDREA